MIEFGKCVMTK